MKRFGEKLRILRKASGLTLQELAQLLGHSDHSFLSKVETGKKSPSLELIISASKTFGVSTDALLFDEKEVEIFRRGDEVVLRKKPQNLLEAFKLLGSMEGEFQREQPPMQERDFSPFDKEKQ